MRLSATFTLNSQANTAQAVKDQNKLTDAVERTQDAANRTNRSLSETRTGSRARQGAGLEAREHRVARGTMGTRGAEGRNFAALAQGSGTDTSGFVAAYATLAANIFAVTAAFQALSKAAQTEQLRKGLELVGAQAGISLTFTAKRLEEISGYGLSAAESMRAVAQAATAGIGSDKIERLGAVARGAALALGRDMSDSMDRLVRGVVKLEPELLDELGIMTRIDDAAADYAKTLNKSVSDLTLYEKRIAFQNKVLEEGEKKFKAIAEAIPISSFDKFSAAIKNLGTSVLTTLVNVLEPLVSTLANAPALALLPFMGIIMNAATRVLPSMAGGMDRARQSLQALKDKTEIYNDDLTQLNATAKSSAIAFAKLNKETKGKTLFAKGVNEEDKTAIIKARMNLIDEEIAKRNTGSAADQKVVDALKMQKTHLKDILRDRMAIEAVSRRTATNDIMQRNAMSFMNSMDDMETAFRRGPFSAIKGLGVGILSDFKREFSTASEQAKNSAKGMMGSFGTFFAFTNAGFAGLTAAVTRFGMAMNAALGWIGLVASILMTVVSVFQFFNQEAEEANRRFKELNDSAKKSRAEIDALRESGRFADAIDAQNNALKDTVNIYDEILKKQKDVQTAAKIKKEVESFGGTVVTGRQITSEFIDPMTGYMVTSTSAATVKTLLQDMGAAGEQLDGLIYGLSLLDKSGGNVAGLLTYATSLEDVAKKAKMATEVTSQVPTTFKAIEEQVKVVNDSFREMASTQDSASVKLSKNAAEMVKSIASLEPTQENATAFQSKIAEYESAIKSLGESTGKTGEQLLLILTLFKLSPNASLFKQLQEMLKKSSQELSVAVNNAEYLAKLDEQRAKTAEIRAKTAEESMKYAQEEFDLQKQLFSAQGVQLDKALEANLEYNFFLDQMKTREAAITAEKNAKIASANAVIAALRVENGLAGTTAEKRAENTAIINQQSAIISQATDAERNSLDLLTAEEKVLKQITGYYDSDLYKQQKALEVKKQELEIEQKMFDLRKGLDEQRLATNRSQVERRAALEGRELTMQEEYDLALAEHKLAIENLDMEHKLALKKFDEEENIRKLSLQNEYNRAKINVEIAKAWGVLTPELEKAQRDAFGNLLKFGGSSAEARGLILATQASKKAGTLAPMDVDKQIAARRLAAERGAADKVNLTQAGTFMPSQMRAAFNELIQQEASITGKTVSEILMDPNAVNRIKTASNALAQQNMQLESMVELMNGIESAMTDAFMSMVDGSKSAKEAFADMAKAILADLAQMIVRQMVYNMLQSAMGFFGFAEGGVIPMATGGVIPMAQGGVVNRSSGVQGVVRQPTYLVGEGRYNEAVVPLPNGRSIPVQMHGQGASQQNNVSVNVNVASNGQATTQTEGPDMNNLGRAIAAAVQKELQAQKRPGGMLNRYGAA